MRNVYIIHVSCLVVAQGLLCAKVGHFYGMSQAENSYIHQSYMVSPAVTVVGAVCSESMCDIVMCSYWWCL